MKDKIIEIIDHNYDPDTGDLDKENIVDEIIELLKIKERYVIGSVDDPFIYLRDE